MSCGPDIRISCNVYAFVYLPGIKPNQFGSGDESKAMRTTPKKMTSFSGVARSPSPVTPPSPVKSEVSYRQCVIVIML